MRPVLDELFEKFQTVYTPDPSIAIDESLLLWKGRIIFQQFLPLKRARFGIKMFCLSEDSGYMYRFRVYVHWQSPTDVIDLQLPQECADFSVTEKIVVHMIMSLLNKGYTIWMDNWYSSCRLYDFLHHNGTMACGTMRSNRVPPEVRNANPQVGQLSDFRSGPLLCLKYKDKKDVYMLTTQNDESVVSVNRCLDKRPRQDVVLTKPMCIVGYNSNMGSVDKQDQMLKPYSIARKSMKWYKKLTMHLLQNCT